MHVTFAPLARRASLRPPDALARVASHRLTHFLVLGALIFGVDALRSPPRAAARPDIDIPEATVQALRAAEARRRGLSALPADKAREVDERTVEDELLYREALRLGLDRDDPIVRQRLIQKVLFLAEDLGGASQAPTPDELRAYYDATKDARRAAPTLHFVHVFAQTEERAAALRARVEAVAGSAEEAPSLGEPFPYARDARLPRGEVVSLYGPLFAGALDGCALGEWTGPVRSVFGWHLVRVLGRDAGGPASFDDVRGELALEYAVDKRQRVVASFLQRALEGYTVRLGGERVSHLEPAKRVAPRVEASAED